MFDHFRLGFLLAALTAGFAFTGCETDDDDDGGIEHVTDACIEDICGDETSCTVADDCAKKTCKTATCTDQGACEYADIEGCECEVADDCADQSCKTATCTENNTCEYADIANCCVEDTDCVSEDSCQVGNCVTGEDGAKTCNFELNTACCNDLHACAEGVCDAEGTHTCVECLVADDCKGDLNGCQSFSCTAEHTCQTDWTAGCCFVAENSEVANNGCESDEFGCYDNDTTAVTAGQGVCVKTADVEACNANCVEEIKCIEDPNPSSPDWGGDTGARIRTTADHCKLNETHTAYCPDPTYNACNEATLECERNSCDVLNPALCAASDIVGCCTPTATSSSQNDHCSNGKACYLTNAEHAGVGQTGSCVLPSEVTACTSECDGLASCESETELAMDCSCKVIDGTVSRTEASTFDCAEQSMVCGVMPVEAGSEETTAQCIAPIDPSLTPCNLATKDGEECPDGTVCIQDYCRAECTSSDECVLEDDFCVDANESGKKYCQKVACTEGEENSCPENAACINGMCKLVITCANAGEGSAEPCTVAGEVCTDGACAPKSCANDSSSCPTDSHCSTDSICLPNSVEVIEVK